MLVYGAGFIAVQLVFLLQVVNGRLMGARIRRAAASAQEPAARA
jgi:hypothetical protein